MTLELVQHEVSTMRAIMVGQTAILIGLIRTHPAYENFQLDMAGTLESYLNGPATVLNEGEQAKARAFAESLLRFAKAPDPIAATLLKKHQLG